MLMAESLTMFQELGEPWGIATTMEQLASLAAKHGAVNHAATLWGAAERIREQIGAPLPPSSKPEYDAEVAAARSGMGDESAFDRARQTGRSLSLERAIGFAVEHPAAD
jgi:non-specific serine/threonine protein kinase